MNNVHFDILILSLKTILSMIQGNNPDNKITLMNSTLLKNFASIFESDEFAIEKNKGFDLDISELNGLNITEYVDTNLTKE